MDDFYQRVFKECEVFLGGNTQSFLQRQIKMHLSKTPESITAEDKTSLAKWIKISAALVLNKNDANQLWQKILSLK